MADPVGSAAPQVVVDKRIAYHVMCSECGQAYDTMTDESEALRAREEHIRDHRAT